MYQALDAWLLNRGDNTKTLVGMAKRWLCPLNGGWTACQEIIACHDFCMITIVVAIYLLRPSLFSCHFFHNPPFWRAQKNCDPPLFSTSPPPLLISDKSLIYYFPALRDLLTHHRFLKIDRFTVVGFNLYPRLGMSVRPRIQTSFVFLFGGLKYTS